MDNKKKSNINAILIAFIVLATSVLGVEIYLYVSNPVKETPSQYSQNTSKNNNDSNKKDETTDKNSDEKDAQAVRNNAALMNDMERVIKAINNYQANNRGAIPSNDATDDKKTWKYFEDAYLRTRNGDTADVFVEQLVSCDDFTSGTCKDSASLSYEIDKNKIYVTVKATCDGINVIQSSGSRKIAVYAIGQKESASGVDPIYCLNN